MSDRTSEGDRRGFLKSLGRLAGGGLLLGGVGWLSGRSGKACLRGFRCRGCPKLDDCGEPQAILMREWQRRRRTADTQGTTEGGDDD
ncbi:MAG: hypothetical protein J7M38_04385 [Armatimonadetes bacterium]|nr:hypothetical protein [Armatimonadota bacterium]